MRKSNCFLVVFLILCTFVLWPFNTASATIGVHTRLSTPIRGIDVSDWQRSVDWGAVKRSGIKFVMIRCGFRRIRARNVEEDERFVENVRNARAAGLQVGAYFYSAAHSVAEAQQEAEYCLSLIRRFPGQTFEYPIVFDVEDDESFRAVGENRGTMTAMVEIFCRTIERGGYYASFYANPNWLNNRLNGAYLLSKFDLWLAHWGVGSPSRPCGIWQYTDSGRVSGVSTGNVDMDYAYYDYPARIRAFHCNGY